MLVQVMKVGTINRFIQCCWQLTINTDFFFKQ